MTLLPGGGTLETGYGLMPASERRGQGEGALPLLDSQSRTRGSVIALKLDQFGMTWRDEKGLHFFLHAFPGETKRPI